MKHSLGRTPQLYSDTSPMRAPGLRPLLRIALLTSISGPSQVSGDMLTHPADHGSRGLQATQNRGLFHWLHGPDFLWKDQSQWPVRPDQPPTNVDDDRKVHHEKFGQVHRTTTSCAHAGLQLLIQYYPDWNRLLEAVAWLTRYRQFLRQRRTSQTLPQGPLTVAEVAAAKIDIVRQVQHEAFRSDILHLSQKEMKACQLLNRLDLVLVDGVIRVGRRLEKAPIDYASRHPIVLPSHHNVTGLIIRFYHQQEGHMGQEQVLAKMRQEFWVVHARSYLSGRGWANPEQSSVNPSEWWSQGLWGTYTKSHLAPQRKPQRAHESIKQGRQLCSMQVAPNPIPSGCILAPMGEWIPTSAARKTKVGQCGSEPNASVTTRYAPLCIRSASDSVAETQRTVPPTHIAGACFERRRST